MTVKAPSKSKILEEIGTITGQLVPSEVEKLPSYMRKAVRETPANLVNKFSPEAAEYWRQVLKAVKQKAAVPMPQDIDDSAQKRSEAKSKQKAEKQQLKQAREMEKRELAKQRKNTEKAEKEEVVEFDEPEELADIPDEIQIENQNYTMTVGSLIDMLEKGEIEIPHWQRNFVWKQQKQALFIDSVMKRLPIPSIHLATEGKKNSNLQVTDGLQRLTTLKLFKADLVSVYGKTFSQLSKELQKRFLLAKISIIQSTTDAKNWGDIFIRMNDSPKPVNETEIRRIAYPVPLISMIADLTTNSELWLEMFGSNLEFRGLAAVLRAVLLHERYKEYEKPMSTFINTCLEPLKIDLANDPNAEVQQQEEATILQDKLYRVVEALNEVNRPLEKTNKKRTTFRMNDKNSSVNLGLVDVLIHGGLTAIEKDPDLDTPELTEILTKIRSVFLTDSDAITYLKDTAKNSNVYERLQMTEKLVDSLL